MFNKTKAKTPSTKLPSRPRDTFRKMLLIGFPLAAGGAFALQANLVLLAIALFTPVLVFSGGPRPNTTRAWRDPETGLLDETHLTALIDRELGDNPDHKKLATIAASIDNFPDIERNHGKEICDKVIAKTAKRMGGVLRSHDDMSRISRTGFAIMVAGLRTPETSAVITLCERLQQVASEPIETGGAPLKITVSTGFCVAERAPELTGKSLVKSARAALAEAEQNAPAGIRGFSNQTANPRKTQKTADIISALRNGQIRPWFQPQISTDTGEITGFEALARWEHPKRGLLPPASFLPALEAANKLEELGETILNHALRALIDWDNAGVIVPSVAVNFATQELRNPSLVERIKWDVDRFEIDPARLTVEILETVISQHDDDIITRNIRALGAQGFRIDLDDFGTGHASLANIRRFAVDRIKIDQSFVTNVDTDPEQQRMIAAIIGLGERLKIETLAEGLETLSEQSILSQLGCNHLQGFAIAKPMPFDKTIEWIKEHQKTLNTTPIIRKKAG